MSTTGISTCSVVLATVLLMTIGSSRDQAQSAKTEALPADGGDLGKAFTELAAAFKAADKTRAAKLLDPAQWHLDNKPASWFAQLSERLAGSQPSGGRRQGNRATLFVTSKDGYYGMLNATYSGTNWRFDTPTPTGSSVGPVRDCKASPDRFPCGAASAPDAQVTGTVQSHMIDPDTKVAMPPVAVFDGLAVRIVGDDKKTLQSTWVVISGTGINPAMTTRAEDTDQLAGWLNYPVLKLSIAASGNSAKAEFYNGMSRQEFDLTSGLTVDRQTPNRIRGTLKTDVKGIAAFNITFDIGTASRCVADKYQCGD